MRTVFYEIMRKHRVRPIGFLPCATFRCSVATCAGLLVYGDGIECAAESLTAAPSIASLGRGIQSLHQASKAVKQIENSMIQKSIKSLVYRFKKVSYDKRALNEDSDKNQSGKNETTVEEKIID
ncbi:hypothetical protein P3S67_001071 [Capsicum chacoense]